MNILAVGAHPDDIEIGCGGTLIKYAQKAHNVFLLVITKGEQGGDPGVRYGEQLEAAEIIGAKDVFWGEYQDTHVINKGNEIIHTVERHIDLVNPDFIFVNASEDTHQDHRTVNQSVLSATRYVKNVLFYEVPTSSNFTPHVFVNISETLDRKILALEAHRSQVMKTNIEDLSIAEIARSAATFRGIQGRVKHAEAFCTSRLFLEI